MGESVTNVWDVYDLKPVLARIEYDLIMKEFEGLTLEEKVNKLIEAYATFRVRETVGRR